MVGFCWTVCLCLLMSVSLSQSKDTVGCFKVVRSMAVYTGKKNTTYAGATCQRWDSQIPHKHKQPVARFEEATLSDAENFCRDPDLTGYPWCYTLDPKTRWRNCGVPYCTGHDCFRLLRGKAKYGGTTHRTKSGLRCQRWDSSWYYSSEGNKSMFPGETVSEAANFCRDPTALGYLWCHTTDPNVPLERCDLTSCRELEASVDSIITTDQCRVLGGKCIRRYQMMCSGGYYESVCGGYPNTCCLTKKVEKKPPSEKYKTCEDMGGACIKKTSGRRCDGDTLKGKCKNHSYKCCKKHHQVRKCVDRSTRCSHFVSYCTKPSMKQRLESYCPKTCGYCNETTQVTTPRGKCFDKSKRCTQYVEKGLCLKAKYRYFMEKFCNKTCGFCSPETTNPCKDNPCKHGGKCIRMRKNTFRCECKSGFYGSHCEKETNPCDKKPCKHGGKCIRMSKNKFKCKCKSGFYGSHCEKETTNPCKDNLCKHGGKCIRMRKNTFRCECKSGFYGSHCEKETTNPCKDNPCKHGGNCIRMSKNKFKCKCKSGFYGSHCEKETTNPCKDNPCKHGGKCIRMSKNTFRCKCKSGFYGFHCGKETNPCDKKPCKHGGKCIRMSKNKFKCKCKSGFYGSHCEKETTNPCKDNPCKHGGKCIRMSKNKFKCKCKSGFYGSHCEKETTNPCKDNPCKHGGKCIRMSKNTFKCKCKSGFYGSHCEKDTNVDIENEIEYEFDDYMDANEENEIENENENEEDYAAAVTKCSSRLFKVRVIYRNFVKKYPNIDLKRLFLIGACCPMFNNGYVEFNTTLTAKGITRTVIGNQNVYSSRLIGEGKRGIIGIPVQCTLKNLIHVQVSSSKPLVRDPKSYDVLGGLYVDPSHTVLWKTFDRTSYYQLLLNTSDAGLRLICHKCILRGTQYVGGHRIHLRSKLIVNKCSADPMVTYMRRTKDNVVEFTFSSVHFIDLKVDCLVEVCDKNKPTCKRK